MVTFNWPVEIGWLPVVFSGTKEKAIRFAHEMKDDETGEVVARTVLVAVHIDKATRKCWSDLCWLWEATHGQARVETIIGGAERATIRWGGKPLLAITTVGKRAEEILTGKFTGIIQHAIPGITTRDLLWLKSTSIITMGAETVTPTGATISLLLC